MIFAITVNGFELNLSQTVHSLNEFQYLCIVRTFSKIYICIPVLLWLCNVLQSMFLIGVHQESTSCSMMISVKWRRFPTVRSVNLFWMCPRSVHILHVVGHWHRWIPEHRVISPADFDTLYKWLCILASSWNPTHTSWRCRQGIENEIWIKYFFFIYNNCF